MSNRSSGSVPSRPATHNRRPWRLIAVVSGVLGLGFAGLVALPGVAQSAPVPNRWCHRNRCGFDRTPSPTPSTIGLPTTTRAPGTTSPPTTAPGTTKAPGTTTQAPGTTQAPATTSAATTAATTTTTTAAPTVAGAWPNASNTGVPAGTVLTPVTGNLVISTAGSVVDAKDVSGCILIKASNVLVKRTKVHGSPCDNTHQIDVADGLSGVVLQDVEVDGVNASAYGAGIGNGGYACIRCNIHNVGQGVHIDSNVTIQDSYIHDLFGQGDPATTGSHNEPIFAGGGSGVVIRHNELDGNFNSASTGGGMSAALALYGWLAPQTNVVVDSNRFNGGGYCVYGGETHTFAAMSSNVRFTGNHFGRALELSCGYYGPVVDFDATAPGNVWSGNVWDDTGAVVPGV